MAIDLFSIMDSIKTTALKTDNTQSTQAETASAFLEILSEISSALSEALSAQSQSTNESEQSQSTNEGPSVYTYKVKMDQVFVPPEGMTQEEYEAMPKNPLVPWKLPEHTAPLMESLKATEEDITSLYQHYIGRTPTDGELERHYAEGNNSLSYMEDTLKRTQAFYNMVRAESGKPLLTTPDGVAWCALANVPGTTYYEGPASYCDSPYSSQKNAAAGYTGYC